MPDTADHQPNSPSIKELYPEFTTEEQAEAEDMFRRYIELVWRIHQRLRSEKAEKI